MVITPAFVPLPDCRLIAKCVDGFAVVVAAHRTPRGPLAVTLKAMDPEKTVGLVFNVDDSRGSHYEEVYGRELRRGTEQHIGGLPFFVAKTAKSLSRLLMWTPARFARRGRLRCTEVPRRECAAKSAASMR